MKLVYKDLKHGEIKLIPENLDDIWHLYNIISEGDLVRAITYRSIEQQDDKIRTKKTEKKRMKIGIEVKELEFHEFSDRLRILGIIKEGPQDLGSFHTLNITADKMDKISIIKEKWNYYHIDRINEAVKNQDKSNLIFISLDDEAAAIARLRQSGIELITEIKSNKSGKMYDSVQNNNEYFGNIYSTIDRNNDEKVLLVILGPGFVREHFLKYLKEKKIDNKYEIFTHGTSNPGMTGIQEALKSGIINQITKHHRVVHETQLIEKLFEEIKKDGLVTYGEKNVHESITNGAVERLLITDIKVRTKNGEEILNISKKNNSEFTIINTMHEAGKKLESLGGFAAFLRFKL